jgi:hypothetical protein
MPAQIKMKKLTCNIQIGDYAYSGVVNCSIESSYDTLTDTCTITFPRKVSWNDSKITDLIKRGDKIKVYLGYNDENTLVFIGYIKNIKASIPIEITCEDSMYLLKQKSYTESYETVTLKDLLQNVCGDIPFETIDFTFNNLRITKATPAEIFDSLNSDYGLPFYFVGEKLYAGLNIWPENTTQYDFVFQKDIIDHDSLEYNLADTISLKVVAVSMDDNNNKTEIEVGDTDGEQRTFYYYNITQEQLETIANTELERLKYDGYRGTFTTFGTPVVKHGDAIKLTDNLYPEREGIYLVKSVKTTFGLQGYRQEIELDRLKD